MNPRLLWDNVKAIIHWTTTEIARAKLIQVRGFPRLQEGETVSAHCFNQQDKVCCYQRLLLRFNGCRTTLVHSRRGLKQLKGVEACQCKARIQRHQIASALLVSELPQSE